MKTFNFLIVEDSESMRHFIKNTLRELGFKNLMLAINGIEAKKILEESLEPESTRIDLIFCDWMMPKMSGIEVLKEVRSNPELKDIPFVMITTKKDQASIRQAIQEGVNDYVVKPFTANTFIEKVNKYTKKE